MGGLVWFNIHNGVTAKSVFSHFPIGTPKVPRASLPIFLSPFPFPSTFRLRLIFTMMGKAFKDTLVNCSRQSDFFWGGGGVDVGVKQIHQNLEQSKSAQVLVRTFKYSWIRRSGRVRQTFYTVKRHSGRCYLYDAHIVNLVVLRLNLARLCY